MKDEAQNVSVNWSYISGVSELSLVLFGLSVTVEDTQAFYIPFIEKRYPFLYLPVTPSYE